MMKSCGGRVVVLRDPVETSVGGIEVSERALTKNLEGVVVAVPEGCAVDIGDKIHLPHYEVAEAMVEGREYAMFDGKKLFARRGVDGDFEPVNRHVRVRKCVNDHVRDENGECLIHMTDKFLETTNWVEIIAVSGDCMHVSAEDVGCFCPCPEESPKLHRLGRTKDYMLHEDEIQFTTTGG
jgi:co-chaperonin GroES (HSP10)